MVWVGGVLVISGRRVHVSLNFCRLGCINGLFLAGRKGCEGRERVLVQAAKNVTRGSIHSDVSQR